MTTAILDTNVLVQSLIGRSSSGEVLDAYFDGRFQLVYCTAVFDEWLAVLLVPSMRELHGLSDDEIVEFLASMLSGAIYMSHETELSHLHTRDLTDTKFLALAEASHADFLVTNDRRHLLPLGQFGATRVVLPAQFLQELSPT